MVLLQIQRWFQHTAARRRLVRKQEVQTGSQRFNTQPPEGGWDKRGKPLSIGKSFNTQPPEGGWLHKIIVLYFFKCFNTQPPEGGWRTWSSSRLMSRCFNTQPPEGGWPNNQNDQFMGLVSTHSRPKAAGDGIRVVVVVV